LKNFRPDFPRKIGLEKFQRGFAQERRTKNFWRSRWEREKRALKNFKGDWHLENRPLQIPQGDSRLENRS
jgi:hypothetical protein